MAKNVDRSSVLDRMLSNLMEIAEDNSYGVSARIEAARVAMAQVMSERTEEAVRASPERAVSMRLDTVPVDMLKRVERYVESRERMKIGDAQ